MRERFFNNHKLIPHRLDYKFFVPVLALVMIVSSALPTMSANAQPASSISSDITSLEQCIEKFQGSDTTYCGSSYPLQVAKSGQIFSKYRYGSSNSIIVNEQTKVTLSGLRSSDPDSDKLSYSWSQIGVELSSYGDTSISFTAPAVDPGATKALLFIFTADDGHGGRASALVKVTVKSTHISPTVSCPDISVQENTPVTLAATISNPSG